MLDKNEEIDDRVKELEDKLEALRIELEESYEDIDDLRETVENPTGDGFTEVQHGTHHFQVHWIQPSETDTYSSCDDIDSLEKARIAFKEAAIKRDTSSHLRPVNQGDVLFLMCNTNTAESESESEPQPVCSYIGMCAKVDFRTQLENPDSSLNLTEIQQADGDTYREFFAWDSCGASAEPCDREEQYVTVVTASKVVVEPSGMAPEKTHTIRGYEKTKELQFDECGTLVSVGDETDWIATGEEHEIKECCDACESLEGKPSSYTVNLINSSNPALTQSSVMVKNTETCRYEDTTFNRFLTLSGGTWTLQAFGTTQTKPENAGPIGVYLTQGVESLTVSA